MGDTVESFDGDAWKSAPSMLETRTGFAAMACSSILYAMGGSNNSVLGQSSVEAFNRKVWSHNIVAPLPLALDDLSGTCNNGRLYIVGGYVAQIAANQSTSGVSAAVLGVQLGSLGEQRVDFYV